MSQSRHGWAGGRPCRQKASEHRLRRRAAFRLLDGPACSEWGRKPKNGASAHICVNEPWPFGVVMPSQEPLATYFQWCGS